MTHFGPQPNYHSGKPIYTSESELYELMFSSKVQITSDFKYCVFEVLPFIRKLEEYKTKKYINELKYLNILHRK